MWNGVERLHMAQYIPIIMLLFLLLYLRRKRSIVIAREIIKNRKSEDKIKMRELAKRFIDKECLVYAYDNSSQFMGVIKEVTDSALLIEKNGMVEAINLDFVLRIREYPVNKKGKKKSVVLD